MTISAPDTRLQEVAATILQVLTDGLTVAGIDVPERSYYHSGEIAYDPVGTNCADSFILTWIGSIPGTVAEGGGFFQSNDPIRCSMPLVAQYVVAFTRCVPTFNERSGRVIFPTAAELQASADQILIDAQTLAAVIIDEALRRTLTGIGCSLAGLGDVTPIGPSGVLGGCTVTLTVGLV